MQSDILIIGGGLIGSSIAYEATRRGFSVRILTNTKKGQAFSAAAGMLAPVTEAEPVLEPITRLGLESLKRYPHFIEELSKLSPISCDFHTNGTLMAAVSHDHFSCIEHIKVNQERMGLKTHLLDAEQIRELSPNLSPKVQGGLLMESDHHLDPQAMVSSFNHVLHEAPNASIHQIDKVETLSYNSKNHVDGVFARIDNQTIKISAKTTIIAAGAWTHQIPGANHLPMRPLKGQIIRLRGPLLIQHTIRTPDIYLVPRSGGILWVGASVEEMGYDTNNTAGEVMQLLWEARRILPGISELEFVNADVGFRPTLRDHLPAIGPTHQQGLWICTGHHRHGVLLLPATTQLLLDSIYTNQLNELLEPFSPKRFAAIE